MVTLCAPFGGEHGADSSAQRTTWVIALTESMQRIAPGPGSVILFSSPPCDDPLTSHYSAAVAQSGHATEFPAGMHERNHQWDEN